MDDLDQLREIFGNDADRVYRGMRELYGEMGMTDALEAVLRVMDKARRNDPLTQLEQRVLDAMNDDTSTHRRGRQAILTQDVPTGLGLFTVGTRVEIVDTLSDGRILVSAGVSETAFPVPPSAVIHAPHETDAAEL